MDLNSPIIQININDSTGVDTEEVVDYMEDTDEEAVLPIDKTSTLLLSNVYMEAMDEFKQYLINKRRENEERQRELKNNSTYKTVRDVTINNYGYSHPNSLIPFMAPYFKDVKGLTAPFNADTIEKRNNGEINESYVCTNKPWNVVERQRLQDILQRDSVERRHKPLRDEKERLTKDKKNIVKNMDRITELTEELEEIGAGDAVVSAPDRWDPSLDWLKFATELDSDHTADECELFWNNFLHPSVNTNQWNREEDKKLEDLVKQYGMHDWDRVAQELGTGRLAWQCCKRYQSELNRELKRVGPLTKAEAETVEKVIDSCRVGDFIPWHQVKYFIEGRTLPQIKHYWNKINVAKRGDVWNDDENKVLTAAVKKYGTHNWRKVAQFIPGRSNRQCRERYMMRLNFGTDRKLGNWTAQEDRLILELAPELNFQWVKLESRIKGRNARQIASRYELLMKYKAKGHDFRHSKNKLGKKSRFATRTLTVKNSLYEKIRQMIHRNNSQNEDLDRILRIGREKLAKRLEMEAKGIVVTTNKGRPKKTANEENIDSKIIELFAVYDHKNSSKRPLARGNQDQCVYDTTKHIVKELLIGDKYDSPTELPKAIRLLFENSVTCNPNQLNETIIPNTVSQTDNTCTEESNSEWIPSPVFPPNRTTVRALRGLLLQTDVFSKIIAKSKIPLETFSAVLKDDKRYEKLLTQFKSLFCWPAMLSLVEPPEREPQTEPIVEKKSAKKQRNSWLKTDSNKMIEIRTNQTKLIHSEMKRNMDNVNEPQVSEEPLNVKSTLAPWYVQQRDRKYYKLKSLDKSSFVFTRLKPTHDSIDKTEQKIKKPLERNANELMTKSEDTSDRPEKRMKRKRVNLKKSLDEESDTEIDNNDSEPEVEKSMTRSQSRRSTRSSTKALNN